MKYFFTLLFAFSFGIVAQAQNYLGLPDSGGVWTNSYSNLATQPWVHCELVDATNFCSFGEDTLINSNQYFKIDSCEGGYKGAFRNFNGKSFYVPRDSVNEYLLYDLSVNEGDTVYNVYFETYWGGSAQFGNLPIESNSVDSILIFGEYHKRIAFSGGYWIEGIGNTQGLFLEPNINISTYCLELKCMSRNDSTLYPSPSLNSCDTDLKIEDSQFLEIVLYPNPTSGTLYLKQNFWSSGTGNLSVFDFEGRRVFSETLSLENKIVELNLTQLSAGIYFVKFRLPKGDFTSKLIIF